VRLRTPNARVRIAQDFANPSSRGLRESKKHADLMFSGTVTNVRPLTVGRLIVSIDVDQIWKGRLRRATTIYLWIVPAYLVEVPPCSLIMNKR
jgi:hypothetical protein